MELIVDPKGVVRERDGGEAASEGGFIMYDLEGELFFGAAAHFERCLDSIMSRIREERPSHLILRLKRVRHPDTACLESLEEFLKECGRLDVTALLAGVQADLLAAAARLGFFAWFPQDRIYRHGNEEDSATLAALRRIYRESAFAGNAADAQRALFYRP